MFKVNFTIVTHSAFQIVFFVETKHATKIGNNVTFTSITSSLYNEQKFRLLALNGHSTI